MHGTILSAVCSVFLSELPIFFYFRNKHTVRHREYHMIAQCASSFVSAFTLNPARASEGISREAALFLALNASDDSLFSGADALRRATFGRRVELCAIINARNGNCGMDCAFCAQSRHSRSAAASSPLLAGPALREHMQRLTDLPLRHVGIVTSGGALAQEDVKSLVHTLQGLPKHFAERWQGRVCGSLGRLDSDSLHMLHEAGLVRFHHNLETSEDFYPEICSTQSWRDRLETVRRARDTGLEVCSGGLFGMGESWEQRVDFALRLRQEGVRHVPVNFLNPRPGTRLEGQPVLEPLEALRIIAVLRHILPTATLRVCGGRPLVLGDMQPYIFSAGANALMTGDYLTTEGKGPEDDCAMIAAQNLEIVA